MTLRFGSSTLSFVTEENGWTNVYLIKDGTTAYLGSDDKQTIIQRLLEMLTRQDQAKMGNIGGIDVRWVLTLSEKYHVLYASYKAGDGSVRVFWQDAGTLNKIIDESVLDVDCQTVLIKSLKSELSSIQNTPRTGSDTTT